MDTDSSSEKISPIRAKEEATSRFTRTFVKLVATQIRANRGRRTLKVLRTDAGPSDLAQVTRTPPWIRTACPLGSPDLTWTKEEGGCSAVFRPC